MNSSVFKIFFSKISEEKWLNTMGEQGYSLTSVKDSKYTFTKHEGKKFNYSIQQLGFSPNSEDAMKYFKSLEKEGIKPFAFSGNWAYFAKDDGVITPSAESYKKNSIPYFWRALYMLFFAICGSVVCGYQIFAIGFLERVGYEGKGFIQKTFELSKDGGLRDGVVNILKGFGNAFFKLLNAYFKIWTNIFGNSDAVAVISIVAPITILLLIFGALNLQRYFSYRSLAYKSKNSADASSEEIGDIIDAKQNV
ncbi:MAG: DUF2812 domain-containing protein [Clostridia bacterium]|nr:DUF2812 domain-containing protein [Clostridia bacterium]